MKEKTWIDLPTSKYGIEYVLKKHVVDVSSNRGLLNLSPRKVIKYYLRKSRHKIWNRSLKASPFEIKMNNLDRVTRRDGYKDGTAIIYIREVFELGDIEYDHIGSYVCAAQLSKEQVDRLKIMIIPKPREDLLLAYLDYYKNAYQQDRFFNESSDVVRHFEGFHRRYLDLGTDGKAKLDLLFSFTFAIKQYSGWIFKFDSAKKRSIMIRSLAGHWRILLEKYTAADLALDLEFSYPALLTFLEKFKTMCEHTEFFGQRLEFVYQSLESIKAWSFSTGKSDETLSTLTSTVV